MMKVKITQMELDSVNELDAKLRFLKLRVVLGNEGREPMSLLSDKSIILICVILSILLGSDPLNPQDERSKCSKAVRFPIEEGIPPNKEVPESTKYFKTFRSPIELGIFPEKNVKERSNHSKVVELFHLTLGKRP